MALNQTSVLRPSLGQKKEAAWALVPRRPRLSLCQLICHCGLIDQRTSQPLSLMVQSSVGSSHKSQLKPYDTEHHGGVVEEEREENETKSLTGFAPLC